MGGNLKSLFRGAALACALLGLLLSSGSARANEDRPKLHARQSAVSLTTGLATEISFQVRAPTGFRGRLVWRYSANSATLARGEQAVVVRDGSPVELSVRITAPSVKVGVVFPTQLQVQLLAPGGKTLLAEQVVVVSVFTDAPFAARSKWLDELRIVLFDPVGDTAKQFTEADIPFEKTRNMASLDSVAEGMIVVGEGTSFRKYRGLAETLTARAEAGVPVLCLAPADARFALPSAAEKKVSPTPSVVLETADVLRKIDKRLAIGAWPGESRPIVSELTLDSDRSGVFVDVVSRRDATVASAAWVWLELRYRKGNGSLLVSGVGITENWDANPCAKHLLIRILERMSETGTAKQSR